MDRDQKAPPGGTLALGMLRDLRSKANFTSAVFHNIGPSNPADPLPTSEADVDAFIRRRTQIYRDSWVNPIIDALIEREERIAARPSRQKARAR